jgi:hypothetical protein
MTDTNLKVINVIQYNGKSINLNSLCMSHTFFQKGEILEATIYNDTIVIKPAIFNPKPTN